MQNYTEIPESQSLTSSRALLLDNDKTALSNSSGTAFPTQDLQVGMFCWRTDQNKLYQLTALTPTWVEILSISGSTVTITGNITGSASSASSATSATNSTNATNVGVTNDTTGTGTHYIAMTAAASGNTPVKISSTKLTFQPSTGNFGVGGSIAVAGSRVTMSSNGIGFEMGPGAGSGDVNAQGYFVPAAKTLWFGANAGAGTFTLDGSGNLTANGNVTAYSDRRIKKDLVPIQDALGKVRSLVGYTYTRIDTGERQTGLVAQDVQAVLPEAVVDNGEVLSVAYGNMAGLLVQAINEMQSRIEALEARA